MEKIMEILNKICKKNISINEQTSRTKELIMKYEDDAELFELLILLREENSNNKLGIKEDLLDLGERKSYDNIIHRIYKNRRLK